MPRPSAYPAATPAVPPSDATDVRPATALPGMRLSGQRGGRARPPGWCWPSPHLGGGAGRPDVAVRPDPLVWSPLEYACHVRDVLRLFTDRAVLIRAQENPLFANWTRTRPQSPTATEADPPKSRTRSRPRPSQRRRVGLITEPEGLPGTRATAPSSPSPRWASTSSTTGATT